MISLTCTSCSKKYKVATFDRARRLSCPKCEVGSLVPAHDDRTLVQATMPEPAARADARTVQMSGPDSVQMAPDPVPPRAAGAPPSIDAAGVEIGLEMQVTAGSLTAAMPTRLGDVRLVSKIGEGGMGIVFRGHQEGVERSVAVKMILPQGPDAERLIERLKREVKAVGKLRHPGIVAVHAYGEHEGNPYYVMDYVEGRDLDVVLRDRSMPLKERIALLRDAALAVDYAHRQGVIHRDLKPSNLMLDGEGTIKLLDFGLAKDTRQTSQLSLDGEIMGTPSYMSPEQAEGLPVEATTDVYSLGAIMYWLLTDRPPFEGTSALQTVFQVVNDEPIDPRTLDPSIDESLTAITLKALNKAPSDRYLSAALMARDLTAWLNGDPVMARMPTQAERWKRQFKRHQTTVVAVAAALLIGLLGVIGVAMMGPDRIDALAAALEEPATSTTAFESLLTGYVDGFDEDERARALALIEQVSTEDAPATRGQIAERFLGKHLGNALVRTELFPRLAPLLAGRLAAGVKAKDGRGDETIVGTVLDLAGKAQSKAFHKVGVTLLKHGNPQIRLAACTYFDRVPYVGAFNGLNALFWDPECGEMALKASSQIYDSGLFHMYGVQGDVVSRKLTDMQRKIRDYNKRLEAANDAAGGGAGAQLSILTKKLTEGPVEERRRACFEIARRKLGPAVPALVSVMGKQPELASSAAFAIHRMGMAYPHKDALIGLLGHADPRVRVGAARAMSGLKAEKDVRDAISAASRKETDAEAKAALLDVREKLLD